MPRNSSVPHVERLPSGIEGLDTVLQGGFVKGGIYIVQGAPGTGKTILGNQICFHHIAAGGKAAYLTVLAESHSRMMLHIGGLSFFDPEQVSRSLVYLSAYNTLESEGLKGMLDLVRREVRGHAASVLVIDGLVSIEDSAGNDQHFKKFIHELQSQCLLSNCTTFLLSSGSSRVMRPEKTMVDGIVELSDQLEGRRRERKLEVTKFRGSAYLRGQHAYDITDEGVVLYPRIESLLSRPTQPIAPSEARTPMGVGELDHMLGGGLRAASSTLLVGPSGSGKTTFGLHFLSGCSKTEKGLYFSFYENEAQACKKAKKLDLNLRKLLDNGSVRFIWNPTTENILDGIGNQLLRAANEGDVRRIFIDGLDGFRQATPDVYRIVPYFTALTNEFRACGRTTLFTLETASLRAADSDSPPRGISAMLDNWMALRLVEIDSQVKRALAVLKTRDSEFDPTIREFMITDRGVALGGAFQHIEGVLQGIPHHERTAAPKRAGKSVKKQIGKAARPRSGPRKKTG
jgi:circadian clock protein KaiC